MTALPHGSGFWPAVRAAHGASAGAEVQAGPAAARVLPALAEASRRTGASFDALFQTARLESGFDPGARARTSSATGLFQFIDSTWLGTLARHGAKHGLLPASRQEALELRRDPYAASLMAAHHMSDNAAALAGRIGRQPGAVELYLAHFLGAGGAGDFLETLAEAPDRPAAQMLPAAARANRGIFFTDGRPRSVAEVYDLFARKLGGEDANRARMPSAAQAAETAYASVGQAPSGRDSAVQALQSARLAYLLLADLGA